MSFLDSKLREKEKMKTKGQRFHAIVSAHLSGIITLNSGTRRCV